MGKPERAVCFEVYDLETHSPLATSESWEEIHEILAKIAGERPGRGSHLAIVSFDEEGLAISSEPADDFVSFG